jgi:hypothetical protein
MLFPSKWVPQEPKWISNEEPIKGLVGRSDQETDTKDSQAERDRSYLHTVPDTLRIAGRSRIELSIRLRITHSDYRSSAKSGEPEKENGRRLPMFRCAGSDAAISDMAQPEASS